MDIVQKFIKASLKEANRLEQYKKDQAYYRNLFIKSGAISEEDLAKYIISIEAAECGEPDWNLDLDYSGSAKFDSKITFNFRDRTTKTLYKFVYNVSFTVGVDGWYSPGDYWDPPEEDTWLTGDIYIGEVEEISKYITKKAEKIRTNAQQIINSIATSNNISSTNKNNILDNTNRSNNIEVHISTKQSTINKQLDEMIDNLQQRAANKPIIAPVKLRVDSEYEKTTKDASASTLTENQINEARKCCWYQ